MTRVGLLGVEPDAEAADRRPVRRALEGVRKQTPVSLAAPDRYTEAGAAERFNRINGDKVRYIHPRQQVLLFGEHHWQADRDAEILRLAFDFVRDWQREAFDIPDADIRAAALKFLVRLERHDALQSMLTFAYALKPVADAGEGWDAAPDLLGVPNGTVNLRTGQLRPGRRDDQITLVTGVAYDPDAHSALWEDTLTTVFVEDVLIDFVQVAAGYSTTGDMRRDCWFLAHGKGRNGKGTTLHPIRRALGDYGLELPASIFDQRQTGAPYDLAQLPGKRFVMCSESGDTIRLHHDRIKQISGGDPVRAAGKYQHSVQFDPTCKLWLSANKPPRVDDDSLAFWARVMKVPFPVTFAGREDRERRPALEHDPAHQAAVLAWLVAGSRRYYADGLHPPAIVTEATTAYEQDSDVLGDFIGAWLTVEPEAEVSAADLYAHYCDYARSTGLSDRERLTQTMFGRRMSARFPSRRVNGRKLYIDVERTRP